MDNGIKVVRTSAENEFGVYKGMIYKDGVLVKGTASTFFPANWTGTQVVDAVAEAWKNITETNVIENSSIGLTESGMRTKFLFDNFGEIISAFPLID